MRTLKLTNPQMQGEDVKQLQNKLNQLGFNCGNADGYFGPKTDAAVRKFQSAHQLVADGVVGPLTWNALGNTGGQWIYPVNAIITSGFGYRIHPITGQKKLHTGIDFGASYGTEVKASGSGKIIVASNINGYGNTVKIDHGNGIVTLYAHNSQLNVSIGQTVQQGQVISHVGSTGNSTGPHLHFEFIVNGTPVDPATHIS